MSENAPLSKDSNKHLHMLCDQIIHWRFYGFANYSSPVRADSEDWSNSASALSDQSSVDEHVNVHILL